MTLTLRISNMTTLPDGGNVEYVSNKGRFEIGRDPGMDWTLPDPNRFVSSCHAEVRWENDAYWLYDVSTNGTFVNGASMRVKSPYQIQNGDRIQFGHYMVDVIIAVQTAAPGLTTPPAATPTSADPGAFGGGGGAFGAGAAFSGAASSAGADPFAPQTSAGGPFGGADPFSAGTSDPFGAQAPGGSDPFGAASASQDPFGSSPGNDPFGASPAGAGGDPFGGGDLWSVPGTPAADPSGFGSGNVAPPSPGDAGNELIQMTPAAPSPGSESPFGAPSAAPAAPAAPANPAFSPADDSGSPFGDSAQTAPPAAPPAAANPQPSQTPPGEGFGAAPAATKPAATPAAAPTPTPAKSPAPASSGDADAAMLRAICEGAGLRPEVMQGVDPAAVGYEIGQALRIVSAELASLLRVRSEGKQRYEKSSRTMIGREANNPLKFIPTANEALEVMFGPQRQGYLRGPQTMQSSFDDIKRHQYAIQAALQPALARLLEDLSPEAIEDKVGATRFGSKSAKAWDLFVERWDAKTHPYENGMLDVFQAYFSDAYNDASKGS